MKRILFLFLILLSTFAHAFAQVIYEGKGQRWELVDIKGNDNVTAVEVDVHITNNQPGCIEAHEYDKRGFDCYLYGDFGTCKFLDVKYSGEYRKWALFRDIVMNNYYKAFNEGNVVHCCFYFTRIPAGIKSVNWHMDGGQANIAAPSKDYHCPVFTAMLTVAGNVSPTEMSDWTEAALKEHWSSNQSSPLEGIYSFAGTTNPSYWGKVRHRIAIKKSGSEYLIIYLSGRKDNVWTEGEIKGRAFPTTTPGLYKVDVWHLENKMLSDGDFYIEYERDGLKLYDLKKYVETQFIKLFPVNELEETPPLPSANPAQKEDDSPKGNGTGFFVSSDIIATNHHVVDGAKKIKIVVQDSQSVRKLEAKVVCADKVNDLALLQITDEAFVPLPSLPYVLSPKSIDVGSPIFTMGYPMENVMGSEIKVTDGIISSKTGYQGDIVSYQISAPIQPGNSGGPMFSRDGILVGITSAGIPGANNVGYAIKSSYLNNLLDAAPVAIKEIGSNSLASKSLPEQVKMLSPYVVIVLIY